MTGLYTKIVRPKRIQVASQGRSFAAARSLDRVTTFSDRTPGAAPAAWGERGPCPCAMRASGGRRVASAQVERSARRGSPLLIRSFTRPVRELLEDSGSAREGVLSVDMRTARIPGEPMHPLAAGVVGGHDSSRSATSGMSIALSTSRVLHRAQEVGWSPVYSACPGAGKPKILSMTSAPWVSVGRSSCR
jgi:hypothetical protein